MVNSILKYSPRNNLRVIKNRLQLLANKTNVRTGHKYFFLFLSDFIEATQNYICGEKGDSVVGSV